MHHRDSWIKKDQLDVTCFIISLFTAQHVSNVSTSIFRSLRLVVDLFHGLYCSGSMSVGVTVWFGWGGVLSLCRLKQSFSLHSEIIKQVTSSWSIFIQLSVKTLSTPARKPELSQWPVSFSHTRNHLYPPSSQQNTELRHGVIIVSEAVCRVVASRLISHCFLPQYRSALRFSYGIRARKTQVLVTPSEPLKVQFRTKVCSSFRSHKLRPVSTPNIQWTFLLRVFKETWET